MKGQYIHVYTTLNWAAMAQKFNETCSTNLVAFVRGLTLHLQRLNITVASKRYKANPFNYLDKKSIIKAKPVLHLLHAYIDNIVRFENLVALDIVKPFRFGIHTFYMEPLNEKIVLTK